MPTRSGVCGCFGGHGGARLRSALGASRGCIPLTRVVRYSAVLPCKTCWRALQPIAQCGSRCASPLCRRLAVSTDARRGARAPGPPIAPGGLCCWTLRLCRGSPRGVFAPWRYPAVALEPCAARCLLRLLSTYLSWAEVPLPFVFLVARWPPCLAPASGSGGRLESLGLASSSLLWGLRAAEVVLGASDTASLPSSPRGGRTLDG